jgi:acetoin utilization deacetylase AcuC-like enzyme
MLRAWTTARWSIPLPDGHRFPMAKYAMIRDGIVRLGLLPPAALHEPDPASADMLTLVHAPDYVDAVFHDGLDAAALRRLGFPWRPELPERARRTVQGTLEAARDALAGGAGVNLAGGTHHAFPDHGEGFCVFNDVAVAIRVLQREGAIRRAAIVDLDVHQGNGSAAIFAGDPDVCTFSMHGANNYPFRKEQSRLDVELEDGCDDAGYLARLERHLEPVLTDPRPDLVVYIAGADPYAEDRLGRLRLSIEGLARRDRMVLAACRRLSLPVVVVLGGGYARDLADVVTIHANTLRLLIESHG